MYIKWHIIHCLFCIGVSEVRHIYIYTHIWWVHDWNSKPNIFNLQQHVSSSFYFAADNSIKLKLLSRSMIRKNMPCMSSTWWIGARFPGQMNRSPGYFPICSEWNRNSKGQFCSLVEETKADNFWNPSGGWFQQKHSTWIHTKLRVVVAFMYDWSVMGFKLKTCWELRMFDFWQTFVTSVLATSSIKTASPRLQPRYTCCQILRAPSRWEFDSTTRPSHVKSIRQLLCANSNICSSPIKRIFWGRFPMNNLKWGEVVRILSF